MKVSSTSIPATSLLTQSAGNSAAQSLYQSQSAYQAQQSSITMKTAEGDVVTISGFTAAGSQSLQSAWSKAHEAGTSFTEAAIQNSSLQISVKGDLNEQELQDINSLLDDLQQLSTSFFSGDNAQAMQQALAIGDMGSVTQLQASFQYNARFSGQYAYQHPLPASFGDRLQNLQQDLASLPNRLQEPLDQLLQAQWAQIDTFLNQQQVDKGQLQTSQAAPPENGQQPPPSQSLAPSDTSLASFLDAMKKRITTTIANHPRLSPHTLPLARKALQHAHAAHTDNRHHYGSMLHGPIMRQLKSWLLAA